MNKFDWFDKLTIYIGLPFDSAQGKLAIFVRFSAASAFGETSRFRGLPQLLILYQIRPFFQIKFKNFLTTKARRKNLFNRGLTQIIAD